MVRLPGIGFASIVLLVLSARLNVPAQTAPPSTPPANRPGSQAPPFQSREPRYQIRPGDVFDLVFSFAPQFNQTVSVEPDGFVVLRELGQKYVLGKTIPELKQLIASSYANVLVNPVVTVIPKNLEQPHFVVGGQVEKPGKYDLRADTTVMEAVAIAGGLKSGAKDRQVLLLRRISDDWVEVKKINFKTLEKGEVAEDMHLRPGDMLFVPKNRFSKIKPFLPITSLGAYLNPALF